MDNLCTYAGCVPSSLYVLLPLIVAAWMCELVPECETEREDACVCLEEVAAVGGETKIIRITMTL